MKILIIGGKEETDFLIDSLLSKKHEGTIVNRNQEFCDYLAEKYDIPVICNDVKKEAILYELAYQNEYDMLIAIRSSDADNLAFCQYAKNILKIQRVVCIVNNPKNVEVFKTLGISHVISATYMLSRFIEQSSMIDSLTKTLSEDEDVQIIEITIKEDYLCCHKCIKDIGFPNTSKIGTIFRNGKMIVPIGNTRILPNDRLVIIASSESKEKAIEVITRQ